MNNNKNKMKQAWFTIIRVKIKEHPGASLFIHLLLFFPIPIIIFKLVINFIPKRVFNDVPISKNEIKSIIGARGILIDIKTKDEDRIFIKNI